MPSVWARKHGDGRVYYNSLGHREDVWANPLFQNMLMAGFSWTMGKVDFDPVTRVPFELAEGMGGRP